MIEGLASPVITKVDDRKGITIEEKEILATFVSFLRVRVPEFEKEVNELSEKGTKKIFDFLFSSELQTSALIQEYENKTGQKCNISPRELIDFIHGGRYALQFYREHSLKIMLNVGMEMIKYFMNMNWLFLQSSDERSFVTSDNPFVLIPPKDYNPKGFYRVGIITHGAKKVIPLSVKTCLIMGDRGQEMIAGDISSENVRKINIAITAYCDRFVIARDKPLLERLVKLTKINEWKIKSRVQVG